MSIANSIRAQIPPIHPEGYPFIGGFALASPVLFWIWTPLGWIGTFLTVLGALFFRDPGRGRPGARSGERRLCACEPGPVLDLDAARLDRHIADCLVRALLPRPGAGDAGA